jgi:hypothetical protein
MGPGGPAWATRGMRGIGGLGIGGRGGLTKGIGFSIRGNRGWFSNPIRGGSTWDDGNICA